MEQAPLTYRTKSKLLLASFLIIGLSSLPFAFPHILVGHGIYYMMHVASISLGAFLCLVGFFTYRAFHTTRLFLVMCAFLAVTMAESFSFVNMIFLISPSPIGLEGMISHGLILLMLTFFASGIFRSN
jgi:hypothetical protein